jgi:membrane associated rhomboid family serine protease
MEHDKFDFTYVFGFIAILFFIHLTSLFFGIDYYGLCLVPRNVFALQGIFTMPLLHDGFEHLFSNIISYLIVSFVLFSIYARIAKWVFWAGYFFTGIIVWIIGRDHSCHIGASGLIYCLSFFLMASGFIRRDNTSLIAAILVVLFNQGLLAGILPLESKVSWEGHLAGAVVGICCAYIFRNINRALPARHIRHRSLRKRFFEEFDI